MKLLAAVVVLLVGFVLASLFPRTEDPSPARSAAPVGVALRRATKQAVTGVASPQQSKGSRLFTSSSPPPSKAPDWPEALATTKSETSTALREPPSMPAAYAALAAGPADRSERVRSSMGPAIETPPDNRALRPIVHEVVDGDSLAGLAVSYLGDAALGERIAAANGGHLADPLPIGMELRIPPRSTSSDSQLAGGGPARAQTRLVPVEPAQVIADAERR